MQEILLESIRTDGTQSRDTIDKLYVAELVELLNANKKLPHVDVYKDGNDLWLADGFHRFQAHQDAGRRTIRAEVHKGDRAAARWHSIGANQAHGLRRTNADKRKAVTMALEDRPGASDALIAQHVGVSDRTVWTVRQHITPTTTPPPPPPPPSKSIITPHQQLSEGQPPQIAEVGRYVKQDDAPPGFRIGADGKARKLPPPPPKPKKQAEPEPQLDGAGKQIPDYLQPLFDRSAELKTVLASLDKVRRAVDKAEGDPLWRECNLHQTAAELKTAAHAIRASIPFAVCPWCRGAQPMIADCRGCQGRGALGRFRWELVPAELK